ncbi:hypothetical protein GSI_03147 [Ganoderma sinense ZZ0214-1]|uniref:Uncharacterized protein n=1 Tax=Ganoderma sinense ZZ0214-1 TaxID=1077348 RepID=A0A2G8SKU0_9APHY|nr:hypothetical protein GSI_03147 [Ganoderma sinense ZZ0214-1]
MSVITFRALPSLASVPHDARRYSADEPAQWMSCRAKIGMEKGRLGSISVRTKVVPEWFEDSGLSELENLIMSQLEPPEPILLNGGLVHGAAHGQDFQVPPAFSSHSAVRPVRVGDIGRGMADPQLVVGWSMDVRSRR